MLIPLQMFPKTLWMLHAVSIVVIALHSVHANFSCCWCCRFCCFDFCDQSVTEALYALNFGGAGARLAAKEATRKLTTLFVFSDRQRCHFSLHNVPSSSRQYGEWVSGLRVQYDPSTVPRKVTLLSKRANAAGKSRTLESRGSPTFPSAASRKGGDKNAVVIAAAEAAAAHGRGLTSGPSHAAVTTAAAAKMSFGFAAYLEDVQQYPLDDVKHFVRALLDEMSRRKRRSSGAGTGTASAPNAAGNSSQLGGNTGPRTVNTSSSNGGRPSEQGPSMSSGSGQINISYYEAFRELRGRVEAQFNEFIFPLYANDIFRIVEEFSGSSSSSSGSSGSGTSRNGPAGNSGSGSGAPTQTSDGVSGSIKSTGSGEHSGNGTAQGGYPGDASTQKSRSQSTGGSPSSSADRRKRSKGGSSSSRLSITKSILSFAQVLDTICLPLSNSLHLLKSRYRSCTLYSCACLAFLVHRYPGCGENVAFSFRQTARGYL